MIPEVKEKALKEAISQIISEKVLTEMSKEEAQRHLDRYSEKLTKNQPEIVKYVAHNMAWAHKLNSGYIRADILLLHIAIIINSFYIQDEINDIEKIFNLDNDEEGKNKD